MILATFIEQLPFTALLNRVFGPAVLALLKALGIHAEHPEAPITNFVAMEILVALLLITMFAVVRARISVDSPGGLQHLFESYEGFINDQAHEIIGHGSEQFVTFLSVLGLFILIANLVGLVPTLEAPTASPAVPFGLAICTFFYYHFHGIKAQGGYKYAKHFAGPMAILAPLMVPIELISHFARLLSLTVRLYANMFAGDLVTMVFFSLIPVGVPLVFMALHIGVSLLQAYIFVLLSMVYLQGAVAHEH